MASNALESSIDDLYLVFSRYPNPEKIDGCPCCVDRKTSRRMLHGALRDIDEDEIWSYVFSAFLTIGDVPDFKFFLPRILELQAQHQATAIDPEVALSKLVYADWDNWKTAEHEAVRAYLKAAFAALLALPLQEWPFDDGHLIDSWVCGLSRAVESIEPYLELLGASEHQEKAARFQEHSDLAEASRRKVSWWYADEGQPIKQRLDKNRDTVISWLQRLKI